MRKETQCSIFDKKLKKNFLKWTIDLFLEINYETNLTVLSFSTFESVKLVSGTFNMTPHTFYRSYPSIQNVPSFFNHSYLKYILSLHPFLTI